MRQYPEGLPAVVTLALGMREMVRRHALIRRLAAVETLGSVSVICCDKTGTLTQNQMTAVRLWTDDHMFHITGEGYEPKGEFRLEERRIDITQYPGAVSTLWSGTLAADAYLEISDKEEAASFRMVGDPTEGAIVVAAVKAGVHKTELDRLYPRMFEIPFDSARKCMSTIHLMANPEHTASTFPLIRDAVQNQGIYITACKGVPDGRNLGLCTHYQRITGETEPLSDDRLEQIVKANRLMARQALRVIAVSCRVSVAPDSGHCSK